MYLEKNIFRCIAYEALFWFTTPILFLFLYVYAFNYPASSVLMHLYFVSWFYLSMLTIKLILSKELKNINATVFIVNFLNSSWLFTTIIYYALVIVGLKSWGKVITSELIISYGKQASNFANFLGVNLMLIVLVVMLAYICLFFLCFKFTKKTQYNLSNHKMSLLIRVLLTLFLCMSLSKIYFYTKSPRQYAPTKEPVALTLSLGKPRGHQANSKQGLANNQALNKEEKRIWDSYIPNSLALKKNVILIVVDALTPMHMGIYGYHRENTPFLSQLQKESESYIFHNTHASCSESACGLISLASSRYVHLIPEKPFTLHQALRKHGYKIDMIMGGDHTNFYGLKSLYGQIDNYIDGSMIPKEKYYVNDDSFVLDETKKLNNWNKKPLMLQYHLMSSHQLGLRWPGLEKYQPSKKSLVKIDTDKAKLISNNYYDNGVFQSDLAIKRLVTSLKSKGYLNDALLIVTADHGESLGEHDKWAHGSSVYEEQLKIPLIFFNFGSPINITTVNNRAQVDIAPMTLCALNMPIPKNWNGQACDVNLKRNYSYFLNEPYSGLIDSSDGNHLWKYWKNTQSEEEYVFDLKNDPSENTNLVTTIPLSLLTKWREQLPKIELEF